MGQCTHIYIYIERERERQTERETVHVIDSGGN